MPTALAPPQIAPFAPPSLAPSVPLPPPALQPGLRASPAPAPAPADWLQESDALCPLDVVISAGEDRSVVYNRNAFSPVPMGSTATSGAVSQSVRSCPDDYALCVSNGDSRMFLWTEGVGLQFKAKDSARLRFTVAVMPPLRSHEVVALPDNSLCPLPPCIADVVTLFELVLQGQRTPEQPERREFFKLQFADQRVTLTAPWLQVERGRADESGFAYDPEMLLGMYEPGRWLHLSLTLALETPPEPDDDYEQNMQGRPPELWHLAARVDSTASDRTGFNATEMGLRRDNSTGAWRSLVRPRRAGDPPGVGVSDIADDDLLVSYYFPSAASAGVVGDDFAQINGIELRTSQEVVVRDAKCEPDGRCTPAPLQLPEATSLAEEIVQMRERDPDALVNYTSLVPEQRGCIDTPRMTTLQFSTGGVPYEAGMYDKDFFPGITSVTPEVPALAGYFVTEPLGEVSTTMPDGCANAFIDFQWGVVAAPSDSAYGGGSAAGMNQSTEAIAYFEPDRPGLYLLEVQARTLDGYTYLPICTNITDQVFLEAFCNEAPEPLSNFSVLSIPRQCYAKLALDGRQSLDVNGDRLEYRWRYLEKADGSMLDLSDLTGPNQSLTEIVPDILGDYRMELAVTDGCTPWQPLEVPFEVTWESSCIALGKNNVIAWTIVLFLLVGAAILLTRRFFGPVPPAAARNVVADCFAVLRSESDFGYVRSVALAVDTAYARRKQMAFSSSPTFAFDVPGTPGSARTSLPTPKAVAAMTAKSSGRRPLFARVATIFRRRVAFVYGRTGGQLIIRREDASPVASPTRRAAMPRWGEEEKVGASDPAGWHVPPARSLLLWASVLFEAPQLLSVSFRSTGPLPLRLTRWIFWPWLYGINASAGELASIRLAWNVLLFMALFSVLAAKSAAHLARRGQRFDEAQDEAKKEFEEANRKYQQQQERLADSIDVGEPLEHPEMLEPPGDRKRKWHAFWRAKGGLIAHYLNLWRMWIVLVFADFCFMPLAAAVTAGLMTCNFIDINVPTVHVAKQPDTLCWTPEHTQDVGINCVVLALWTAAALWACSVRAGALADPTHPLEMRPLPAFYAVSYVLKLVLAMSSGLLEAAEGRSFTTVSADAILRVHDAMVITAISALLLMHFMWQSIRGTVGKINSLRTSVYVVALWGTLCASLADTRARGGTARVMDIETPGDPLAMTMFMAGFVPVGIIFWRLNAVRGKGFALDVNARPVDMARSKSLRDVTVGFLAQYSKLPIREQELRMLGAKQPLDALRQCLCAIDALLVFPGLIRGNQALVSSLGRGLAQSGARVGEDIKEELAELRAAAHTRRDRFHRRIEARRARLRMRRGKETFEDSEIADLEERRQRIEEREIAAAWRAGSKPIRAVVDRIARLLVSHDSSLRQTGMVILQDNTFGELASEVLTDRILAKSIAPPLLPSLLRVAAVFLWPLTLFGFGAVYERVRQAEDYHRENALRLFRRDARAQAELFVSYMMRVLEQDIEVDILSTAMKALCTISASPTVMQLVLCGEGAIERLMVALSSEHANVRSLAGRLMAQAAENLDTAPTLVALMTQFLSLDGDEGQDTTQFAARSMEAIGRALTFIAAAPQGAAVLGDEELKQLAGQLRWLVVDGSADLRTQAADTVRGLVQATKGIDPRTWLDSEVVVVLHAAAHGGNESLLSAACASTLAALSESPEGHELVRRVELRASPEEMAARTRERIAASKQDLKATLDRKIARMHNASKGRLRVFKHGLRRLTESRDAGYTVTMHGIKAPPALPGRAFVDDVPPVERVDGSRGAEWLPPTGDFLRASAAVTRVSWSTLTSAEQAAQGRIFAHKREPLTREAAAAAKAVHERWQAMKVEKKQAADKRRASTASRWAPELSGLYRMGPDDAQHERTLGSAVNRHYERGVSSGASDGGLSARTEDSASVRERPPRAARVVRAAKRYRPAKEAKERDERLAQDTQKLAAVNLRALSRTSSGASRDPSAGIPSARSAISTASGASRASSASKR